MRYLLELVKSLMKMIMTGEMMVMDILEQYVYPFLQACATLLIPLNTERISEHNWIEALESIMRIILEIWIAHLAPQELFLQNSRPLFSLMIFFNIKKKNLYHNQFELKKVSLE